VKEDFQRGVRCFEPEKKMLSEERGTKREEPAILSPESGKEKKVRVAET